MIVSISHFITGAAIFLSCMATALYCRRRMDIRGRLIEVDMTSELEAVKSAAAVAQNQLKSRIDEQQQQLATQHESLAAMQTEQQQSAATLNELADNLQTLINGASAHDAKLLQQAIDSSKAELGPALEVASTAGAQTAQAVAVLTTDLRNSETRLQEDAKRLESIALNHTSLQGRIDELDTAASETLEKAHETSQDLLRLRAFAEAANANANATAAQIGGLRTDIESNFNTERLADVEQLAIVAANMAGDGLAKLAVEAPSSISPMLHGHSMMMYQMLMDASSKRSPGAQNGFHLLEIGTTREKWWSQMSTSRLAAICRTLNYRMITVDVDERNTASGLQANRFYEDTVSATTAFGEQFVADWKGELPPYIYIDAYDYEHAHHSDDRQERYIELQGEEISNQACWEMHYKCAVEFVAKCPDNGIVVFDDVFLIDGEWLGKGKTAAPYMLENGFELIASSPQTAVFRKRPSE